MEIKIANEKIAKPRISPEFVTFWLHKFRKLDINRQDHRKWLVNVFINAIYLYDDKMIITFNYKDGTKTITLDEVTKSSEKINTGSDLDCHGAPCKKPLLSTRQKRFFTMISVPVGTGDIPFGYDICFADDIRFAYEGTDIISYRASDISLKTELSHGIINSINKNLPGTYYENIYIMRQYAI